MSKIPLIEEVLDEDDEILLDEVRSKKLKLQKFKSGKKMTKTELDNLLNDN